MQKYYIGFVPAGNDPIDQLQVQAVNAINLGVQYGAVIMVFLVIAGLMANFIKGLR